MTSGTAAAVSQNCSCFNVMWWDTIRLCSNSSQPLAFWMYYIVRWIGFTQISVGSLIRMWGFHEGERDYRRVIFGFRPYSEFHATISTNGLEPIVYAVFSCICTELTMKRNKIQTTAGVETVGQITALMLASLSVLRALWLILMAFRKKRSADELDMYFPSVSFHYLG